MIQPRKKSLLLIASGVMLSAVICAYAIQTQSLNKSRTGATITSRVYKVEANGAVVELGTQTTYISAQGSWRIVRSNVGGETLSDTVADASRNGVFRFDPKERKAERISGHNSKTKWTPDAGELRSSPYFVRDEMVLGYEGIVHQFTSPEGRITGEMTFVPMFSTQPVKQVDYLEGGGKQVIEPTSIEVGEPHEQRFRLPANTKVKDELSSPPSPK